jgi:aminopeptidase
MSVELGTLLTVYGEVAVRVGLNLTRGQRLLIIGPLAAGGVSLEAAPLVRAIARVAYDAGAPLVETWWGDEALQLIRFRHAPRDSFDQFSRWLPKALVEHVEAGDALLSIDGNDPDRLKNEPPELITAVQRASGRSVRPFRELISRNQTNWTVVAAASAGWAAKVFPSEPKEQQVPLLWKQIARLSRLDAADPTRAWQDHLEALARRRDMLNGKRYAALRYRAPGTELTVGLADDHLWVSGTSESRNGITFAPNLPTEEVFTMPHKDRVDGTVRSSKPLSYGGTLIEDFTLRFSQGRVVHAEARTGEAVLRELIATDDGAGRLGEVARVPDSSPIAQAGLLFYNTLFDENAASHLALGSAYKFTMRDGETMGEDDFGRAGGNRSNVHVDFMIGSAALDVDGVSRTGASEPLMRRGEWVRA